MSAAAVKATDARYEEYIKLERKLADVGVKIKGWKHLPDKQHCGWTSATACTDGQRLYVQHGTGAFGCWDLMATASGRRRSIASGSTAITARPCWWATSLSCC